MNKWTSTKEKLPENKGKYLCVEEFCGHSFMSILGFVKNLYKVDKYAFKGKTRPGFFESNMGCETYECTGVTHWMPLPEMPKEELE